MDIKAYELGSNKQVTTYRIIIDDNNAHSIDAEVKVDTAGQLLIDQLPRRIKKLPAERRQEVVKELNDFFQGRKCLPRFPTVPSL